MALEPGYLVSKHVRLVRLLKGGGMGAVWVADHLALHTQVAVKFIMGDHVENPELLARFTREATSAARIKSPHVVQIHDHGMTDEGTPFMVMELLEGQDLSARLKRGGPMPVNDVATVLEQTCQVLAKAHKLGIVHRDIKPGNIFLVETDGDIFVKVLDFGVAKIGHETSELTQTGVMVGTLVYMSPEQLLDARNVDHRADLWSLAVVAYRAITGQVPFNGENGVGALVLSLDRGIYPRAGALAMGLADKVDHWFERAFKRSPSDRFSSAKEMATAFAIAVGRREPGHLDRTEPVSVETAGNATFGNARDHDPPTPISSTALGLGPAHDARVTRPEVLPQRARFSAPTIAERAASGRSEQPLDVEDGGTVGGLSAMPVRKRSPIVLQAVVALGALALVAVGGELLLSRWKTGTAATQAASAASPPPLSTPGATSSAVLAPADVVSSVATSAPASSVPQPASSSVAAASATVAPAASTVIPRGRIPVVTGPAKTPKDYGF